MGASGPPLGQPDDELDNSVGALQAFLAQEQEEIGFQRCRRLHGR